MKQIIRPRPLVKPLPEKRNRFKMDMNKIGFGSQFHKGSWSDPRHRGLEGQLEALKRGSRFGDTKNLSQKDLQYFEEKLAKAMKVNPKFGTIGRRQAQKLLYKVWQQDVKSGKLNSVDFDDFKKVVKAIRDSTTEAALARVRGQAASGEVLASQSPDASPSKLKPLVPLTPSLKSSSVRFRQVSPKVKLADNAEDDSHSHAHVMSAEEESSETAEEPANLLTRTGTPGIKEEADKAIDLPIG